jgi:hypothetical protein
MIFTSCVLTNQSFLMEPLLHADDTVSFFVYYHATPTARYPDAVTSYIFPQFFGMRVRSVDLLFQFSFHVTHVIENHELQTPCVA